MLYSKGMIFDKGVSDASFAVPVTIHPNSALLHACDKSQSAQAAGNFNYGTP